MNRLRIAICDDDPVDLGQVLGQVREYDAGQNLELLAYTKAADLLATSADIVLLDIEMETPNGYEVAKQLARTPDPPVIVFVTKSSAYTLKGYGIALRYLPKPLDPAVLAEALDAAIQEATAHRLYFTSEDKTVALLPAQHPLHRDVRALRRPAHGRLRIPLPQHPKGAPRQAPAGVFRAASQEHPREF